MIESSLAFLNEPAYIAAPKLLGCILERRLNGKTIRVRVVETEAYDSGDAASHSFKPRTPRTDVMFGPPNKLYVYFTYGMHYCINIVTGKEGVGAAVLIRAVDPLDNIDILSANRGGLTGVNITNGPAKLTQALRLDLKFNGHDLTKEPLKLLPGDPVPDSSIVQTTRIGISKNKDLPLRFYIKDNPYVSKT